MLETIINTQLLVKQRYPHSDIDLPTGIDHHFYQMVSDVFQSPECFKASLFQQFDLPVILDYLRRTHTFYLTRRLAEINMAIHQLDFKIPHRTYWVSLLSHFFDKICKELAEHIHEEQHLFPYVDALILLKHGKNTQYDFRRKVELINYVLDHDDHVEMQLRSLIKVLKKERAQFSDHLALNILLTRLELFDLDLTIHAKIENEVLMPKAIDLEQRIFNQQPEA